MYPYIHKYSVSYPLPDLLQLRLLDLGRVPLPERGEQAALSDGRLIGWLVVWFVRLFVRSLSG